MLFNTTKVLRFFYLIDNVLCVILALESIIVFYYWKEHLHILLLSSCYHSNPDLRISMESALPRTSSASSSSSSTPSSQGGSSERNRVGGERPPETMNLHLKCSLGLWLVSLDVRLSPQGPESPKDLQQCPRNPRLKPKRRTERWPDPADQRWAMTHFP